MYGLWRCRIALAHSESAHIALDLHTLLETSAKKITTFSKEHYAKSFSFSDVLLQEKQIIFYAFVFCWGNSIWAKHVRTDAADHGTLRQLAETLFEKYAFDDGVKAKGFTLSLAVLKSRRREPLVAGRTWRTSNE